MTIAIEERITIKPRPNRTIFCTEDRLNRRGVRARATTWGWTWQKTADGDALYVSMGVGERAQAFHRCPVCGYSESSLCVKQPDRLCPSCKLDLLALYALAVQSECGINLGWRRPEDFDVARTGYSVARAASVRVDPRARFDQQYTSDERLTWNARQKR